jgi:hypothetical protein
LHAALRRKTDNSPRSKFGTSTDFLSDQIPNTILRSQQALLLGSLMVLDLWSRKDTSGNNGRLRFDLEIPFVEILYVSCVRK